LLRRPLLSGFGSERAVKRESSVKSPDLFFNAISPQQIAS
jgi:hypothetical protein